MKKITSLLIVLAIVVSAVSAAVPTVFSVVHGFVWGDANDDSSLSMKDVLLVRRHIAGLAPERDLDRLAADVVTDEDINSKDVLKMRRVIAGLETGEETNTDGACSVGEIKIGGRNISRFTIIIPDKAPEGAYLPSMVFAAEEMRDNIRGACGIDINIAYESAAPDTYAIRYKYDPGDSEALGKEGFVIEVTDDGDLVFTCGTMRGALYGTYTFLEDCIGYRYMTGYINYLYKSDRIDVPTGYYDKQVPLLEYRSIGMNGPSNNYAKLRINGIDGDAKTTPENGGGVNPVYPHAHSFVYQMAGWDNWKDPQYEYTGGGEQPCMTAEETYEKIVDFDFELIKYSQELKGLTLGYDFTHVPCSQNDNGNFCTCPDCMAVYREEGSISGALFRLSNRVAETICAEYPMLQIYTVAYFGTQVVPKMTRPDPRVTVVFCNLGCNNHLLRDRDACEAAGGNRALPNYVHINPEEYGPGKDPVTNGMYMDWLKGWLEVTDNVWFWYYCTVFNNFASPSPNLFNFCDDVKYLAELGVKGIYMEGNHIYMDYNFEFMRAYLLCKVLWDPGMSEEEYNGYMDEYLRIVFGDGWEKVKQYIYMTNYAADLKGCWTNNFDCFWDYYDKDYFAEHYEEMYTLLSDAKREAKESSQSIKCGTAMISLNFLGLSATYERDWVNGNEATRARYRERYADLWRKYNDGGITENPYVEGATGGMANFPSSPSTVIDPMKWIGATYTGTH